MLPHVADVIVEAWAPGRLACFEAAVTGLVATFADARDARPDRDVPFTLAAAADVDLLVRLLEEVIFLVDAEGRVPVAATVGAADGGLRGTFATVAAERVEATGAVPKGVSRSEAEFASEDDAGRPRWRCRVTVDV